MQAAAAVDSLKMESPVKKLDFGAADKENNPDGAAIAQDAAPVVEAKKAEEPKYNVAPGIKPEEADEPLLQESPNRFVLFPIQYHEVGYPIYAPLGWDTSLTRHARTDLADVQEARGVVLDGRGD